LSATWRPAKKSTSTLPGRTKRRRSRDLVRHPDVPQGRIFFHHNPTNDAWCRDHGPIFVQRDGPGGREEAIIDWDYNAWGGKYPPYDLDDVIPDQDREGARHPGVSPGDHHGRRFARA
jgi:agmatine deiminase